MYKLLSPLKPNFRRYWKIFYKQRRFSIQRTLTLEALENLQLNGRVLDFGGGKNSNYAHLIKKWVKTGYCESANISSSMNPTFLIDNKDQLPIPDQTFDTILSLNTFEHIFEIKENLLELHRVLKKGGNFIFATPFLYKVHGCPDDYIRPTASWWGKTLEELNMENIEIQPLVWDPVTSGFSICDDVFPFSNLFKLVIPIYGLIYAFFKTKRNEKNFPNNIALKLSQFALGYIITARKIH